MANLENRITLDSSQYEEAAKRVNEATQENVKWIEEVQKKSAEILQRRIEEQRQLKAEQEKANEALKALIPTQELVGYSTKAMGISSQEYHESLKKLQAQAKDAGWSMDALAEGFISASEGQYKLITMNGVSMAETGKLTTSARAYGLTLEEQTQRTNKLRDAAYRNGTTMNELSGTYLRVTDSSYKLVNANGQVYASLEKNIKGTKAATDAQKAFIRHQNELKANLSKIASLTAVAFSFRELGRAADEMADFSNKVKNATGTLKEFRESKQAVIEIAASTGQELNLVGDMFYNVRANIDRMNISQKDALTVTDVFSKALVVSGASAQETGAAFNQLEKAFATGKLGAEGLNTVLQHAPVVAKSLADSLGVPVGALRKLAAQGKLTSDELAKSALKSQDAIEGMFKQTEATISGSMNTLKTRFKEWVDGANGATGASQKLAKAINFVADNINILATSAAAFIAVKITLSIIKTTVEVVNFSKSVLAANTAQKKGIANNIAYAKSLDAVGLSAKKATADIARMNAAQALGSSNMTTWVGKRGAMSGIGSAIRSVSGMSVGGASGAMLVTIAAALSTLNATVTAIKFAQGKDASNPVSNFANKLLGFDNETASMGTALADFVHEVEEFTKEVNKSGSFIGTASKHVSEAMIDKVRELKKIDFWKEVTKFITGNDGKYESRKAGEFDKRLSERDLAIVGAYEEQIQKLQRLNETYGMTKDKIEKFDFDRQIAEYDRAIANAKGKNDAEAESARVAKGKLIADSLELDQLKERYKLQEKELAQKRRLKELDKKNDKVFEDSGNKTDEARNSIDDVVRELIKQSQTLGMSSDDLVRFDAMLNKATETQLKAIEANQKLISEYEKDAKAKQTIANLKDQEQLADKSDMYKRVWQESKNGASRQQLVEIQRLLNNISEKSGNKWESVDITGIMRKTGNSNFNGFSGIKNPSTESKKLEDQAKDMGKLELTFNTEGKDYSGVILADPEFIKKLGTLTRTEMNNLLNQEAKKVKN